MADGFDDLIAGIGRLDVSIRSVGRVAGKALGAMGNEEVRRQAAVVFGSDRKFSGAKRSRNARRAATSSYKITADGVTVFPSGDPWYIFVLGRGRSNIEPRGRALRTPFGPRARIHGGRLAPRPEVLDPAVEAIADRAPDVLGDAIDDLIGRL